MPTEEQQSTESEQSTTFGERMAMLHEQVRAENKAAGTPPASDDAGEAAEPSDDAEPVAPAAAAAPAPPVADEIEQARAARRAALQQLADAERAADAKRQARERQARQEREQPELEKLRAKVAELEKLRADLEPYAAAFEDPKSLLLTARKKGLDPVKFGEVFRESIANPEFAIEQQVEQKLKTVLSPYEQKLQETEKRLNDALAALNEQQRTAQESAAEQEAANELISHTRGQARLAPLSAAFLERHGEEAFVAFATNIAQTLPQGCGLDRVHDALELSLEHLQLSAAPVPTPSNGKSKPTRDPAAKGKTVTNQLASQRATVAEEDEDWSSLPFNERFERLRRRAV